MTRVAVVTGASSGIGAVAARRLSENGFEVAVVGRNPERTLAVASDIGARSFLADFDDLSSVRRLASELRDAYPTIDVLANNAGGLIHTRATSTDGIERTIQLNLLAPFLLTNLLLPQLTKARVISTASIANRFGNLRLDDLQWRRRPWFGGWRAYGTSKIATIVFARELAERTGIESYSFHPGYVATSFAAESPLMRAGNRITPGRIAITAEEGAVPLVELATAASLDVPNGTYFDRLRPFGRVHRSGRKPGVGSRLWLEAEKLTGLSSS
ncbi:NAD(P)-dependent dehydrogenase (short-subunit alcohol dehydrogenase family) [Microbacteriaceae bacterium SG_E_30_P1]|uniref:NAD(P)-dependent dehydrogenase (Short-subunit alcohol dehydrogenase family) n=1 Tax=Antiquaquibacter oligotrophicus TaxID=2880260 RepID=A0ABT6KKJ4_9MICO|nr:SDR family NAD(P)-dependent oxidoreductase [Antiquaquibacter oligotrophicus]MDH6180528.1 NAD(P)-dependent dehydrogenase (short-subunit alcohol dehydrogenase family) [Antiquaquibacter oligotrophicus]UDF13738.1 SDR family NAD(P)-dependent oxidoreductase [Antiquaquibacter oligotrophicus]